MTTTTDPVCGMTIDDSAAAGSVVHDATTYFFCSSACRDSFRADPNRYTPQQR